MRKLNLFFFMLIVTYVHGQKKPNILFILADDIGYETLSIYGGSSYKTPNINKLAQNSQIFNYCFSQPQCTPSRAQLLTGIYNIRNYVEFGKLETNQLTLPQVLKSQGYSTTVIGKWQLGKESNNVNLLGFDDYLVWQLTSPRMDQNGRDTRYTMPELDNNGNLKIYGEYDYGPQILNDYSLKYIENHAWDDRPFFMFYSMMLAHCPFSPTPDSPEFYSDKNAVMSYKGDSKYFPDMMEYLDKMVGNILNKLEEQGILENTLIFFVGDNGTDQPVVSIQNGIEIPGGKLLSTDAGTRVPMLVSWKGKIKNIGQLNENLIDFTDFLPTIMDAINISPEYKFPIDGQSFYSQLIGEKNKPREFVYSWFLNPILKSPVIFARNKKFKLYSTGEFYNVEKDLFEKNPLNPSIEKTDFNFLSNVIKTYSIQRLNTIP